MNKKHNCAEMKLFRLLLFVVISAAMMSCSNKNEHLEKLISKDVAGVVCINVPNVLEKSEIKSGDELVIPDALKSIINSNEDLTFGQVVKNIPNLGIEIKDRAYLYFPNDMFDYVALIAINDEDKAKTLISHRTGEQFADFNGVDCVMSDMGVWGIDDGVLLYGNLRVATDIKKAAKWIKATLDYEGESIADHPEANGLLDPDKEVTAYFDMQKISRMMRGSAVVSNVVKSYPIASLLLDSDIKAVKMDMSFKGNRGDVNVDVIADDNGEYATMMNTLLQKPSNSFLCTIPNSMKLVMSMSVNGRAFASLPQVQKMIKMVNDMPFLGRLDITSMIEAIDGPIAVGVANDPVFADEYNYVFAAQTSRADDIVKAISTFASSLGQDPELYDGELIYAYNNKQVRLGIAGNVVYVKMLNYEQFEPNFDGDKSINKFFAEMPLGIYSQITNNKVQSTLSFGLKNMHSATGAFLTQEKENAMLQFISFLCSIKPVGNYDIDMGEFDETNMVGDFQPL